MSEDRDRQSPRAESLSGDMRVFPIRSIVTVDPSAHGQSSRGSERTITDRTSGCSSNTPKSRISSNNSNSRTSNDLTPNNLLNSPTETDRRPIHSQSRSPSAIRATTDQKPPSTPGMTPGEFRQNQSPPEPKDFGMNDEHRHSEKESRGMSQSPPRDDVDSLVTTRFKHVVTEDGHAIIVGRGGDTLQRCEDEPIHAPGAVQGFGLLIALAETADSKLQVRIVSENCKTLIGWSSKELFALDSFCDILTEEQADILLDHIDFIKDGDMDPSINGPEVFTISINTPNGTKGGDGSSRSSTSPTKLWCAIHINDKNRDLIICEFELENDTINPLVSVSESLSESPEDTLKGDPTPEEWNESTLNMSKPLRLLRGARKRGGEAAAMEVFNIMSQIQEQLANATTVDVFLKVLVGVVRELTGFHRVMIYQFDSTWNGRVVTELVDPRATKDLYKGLNFPASDIPAQAREMYKVNKVRLLYDRDQETARLICRTLEDLEEPLDLTFAYLRAMSPIHIKYLGNMAVRSSMSISINAFNELWGLIACHSYGGKGMRVSFPIRKMCRLIGDTASRNIERLSYATRLQARKLINTVPTTKNPSGYIIASSEDLIKLFDADCGILSIRGSTKILGKIEKTQEALAMLEYLRLRRLTSVVFSTDIRCDFPDLQYPDGFSFISGILFVPLSVSGDDFIVFFRKSQMREVKWAGNPYEKFLREGTEGYLEPRKSFKTWSETVVGKCREWTEEQIETSAVLCLVYGKFIEVWRQKEVALRNSQLTKLLLANSAHEVRTPLNAIINYLEIALEAPMDQETRENLSRSHSASKSLIYVINDLLDLTHTEEGQLLVKDEVFDLPSTVHDAMESFIGEAKRKSLVYEQRENGTIPQYVLGDQRRLRQVIFNMIANAIKFTDHGFVHVETWLLSRTDSQVDVEFVIEDSGCGMSPATLDALFRDLEQVEIDGDAEIVRRVDSDRREKDSEHVRERVLGLGLALVARVVRNMDGQLRLKSSMNAGSRFAMQLTFDLPNDPSSSPIHTQPEPQSQAQPKVQSLRDSFSTFDSHPSVVIVDSHDQAKLKSTESSPSELDPFVQNVPATPLVSESIIKPPPPQSGEITLVDRSIFRRADDVDRHVRPRKKSSDSVQSLTSMKSLQSTSTGRSDVDRLIQAIQDPISASSANSGPEMMHKRSDSASHSRLHSRSPSEVSGLSPTRARPPSVVRTRSGLVPLADNRPREGPGMYTVKDSKTPIRPVRVPEKHISTDLASNVASDLASESSAISAASLGSAKMPLQAIKPSSQAGQSSQSTQNEQETLHLLVAEDDPINSKIMKKRLEKFGFKVRLTVNGEECSSQFGETPKLFDAVLMDIQMPIVDGITSTKMIRSFEKVHAGSTLSDRVARHKNKRIPIFAVSASLVEKEREGYINTGFDGWILKPVDFNRLKTLLAGITDAEVQRSCLYVPGQWEQGGWFVESRSTDPFQTETTPDQSHAVNDGSVGSKSSTGDKGSACDSGSKQSIKPVETATDAERDRLRTLSDNAAHSTSRPMDPGSAGNIQQSMEHEGDGQGS